jgi:hypothetical protein
MRTDVRILRGRYRGRSGWIAGDLDRLNPHVTRALVHVGGDVEPIALASLERDDQPGLFPHEDEPTRPANLDRHGHHRARRDRRFAARMTNKKAAGRVPAACNPLVMKIFSGR